MTRKRGLGPCICQESTTRKHRHTLKDYCRNWPTHSTGEGAASIIPERPSPLLMPEPEAHRVAVRKGLGFHECEGCLNPVSILAVFLKSLWWGHPVDATEPNEHIWSRCSFTPTRWVSRSATRYKVMAASSPPPKSGKTLPSGPIGHIQGKEFWEF